MKITLPDFEKARVLVVGDVMLDRYWSGPTGRISPEAPVPVVKVEHNEERPEQARAEKSTHIDVDRINTIGLHDQRKEQCAPQQTLANPETIQRWCRTWQAEVASNVTTMPARS